MRQIDRLDGRHSVVPRDRGADQHMGANGGAAGMSDDTSFHASLESPSGGCPLSAPSAKFSWIPVPEKMMAPIGSTDRIASLRLNGAAFLWRVQSVLSIDGIALAQAVRARFPSVPVIVTSGHLGGRSLDGIAHHAGFADSAHFSRTFTRIRFGGSSATA
ncbi:MULTISPECIES: hypothetical protein [unclassified Sphingomonas]|uniref:hypothetical protein n=1 Tax=Sphingomonas TaxID=13687 RepID=UPI001AC3D63F|nr:MULTISPECIES: hypothetical protein [unclassified Sphingomonas]MBN8812359.1 hypothetical protein [Sphingomonas sp.]